MNSYKRIIAILTFLAILALPSCNIDGTSDDKSGDPNPTYNVTYNGNGSTGGSVPVDSTDYEEGQPVTVPAHTGSLVKTGYSFVA